MIDERTIKFQTRQSVQEVINLVRSGMSICVASYIDKVIDGSCDIILMRKKNDVENSLVTVEVRNGKVVQARQRFNESVNESEQKALDKYDEFLASISGDKNEKS